MKTTMMNTPRLLGAFMVGALLLAAGGTPANAQLRPPPGLAPGERYRFVFVTSGTGDATNTDITPYDNFVSNAAVAAGLTEYQGQAVSWQALGFSRSVDVQTRVSVNAPDSIYRLDGVKVANNGADLWDGSIANPISVSELGTELNVHVWTGFQPNGTSPTNGSRIWRLGSGSGNGTVLAGNSASVDGAWAFVYNESKFATNHYYAVSNVFMVPLNTPPVANAGADQSVYMGATVALNGGASFDVETASQDLSYAWSLTGPVGSAAMLTGGDTATPSFVADVAGSYALTLTVTDAGELTGSDEVIITVEDPKQVAGLAIVIATDAVTALTPSQVTTKGNQNALGNFLSQALKDIESGDIAKAIKKLQDALGKTDGCALRGSVDGKGSSQDWITTCDAQEFVYELLTKAVTALQAVPAA